VSSVVVVHHWAFARLGAAITEIKTFGDRNGCQARGIIADGRRHSATRVFGRLKANDIIENPLPSRRLAIGKPTIGAFELVEASDALHHIGAGDTESGQRFPPAGRDPSAGPMTGGTRDFIPTPSYTDR